MYVLFWNQKQMSRLAMSFFLVMITGVIIFGLMFSSAPTVSTMQTTPIYQGRDGSTAVALTFNVDWGEEYLPGILETLAAEQVKATFFLTGRWANKNGELAGKIYQGGHEIGNHGYSHPHVDQLSKQSNQEEIRRTERAIISVTGKKTSLYAPPYGESGPNVVNAAWELGYQTIMWTIDTIDWQPATTADDVRRRVNANLRKGAIVLMHPTLPTSQALRQVIADLKKQGWKLMTVSEIVGD